MSDTTVVPFPQIGPPPPVAPGLPPQLDVAPMPVELPPSTPFIPREYEIHLHSQLCLSCGSGHEWSCAYAFNHHATRLSFGKRISHLHAVERFSYNVPVRVVRAPLTTTPACQECVRTAMDLSHLPRPASTEEYKQILNSFAATPDRAEQPKAASPSSRPAPSATIKTLNDLF